MEKYPFTKTFSHTGEAFSATSAAEKWLKERGFSLGTMCNPDPRGILKEPGVHIPKWRYVDQTQLDGMATATNWRSGDVTIHLPSNPDNV